MCCCSSTWRSLLRPKKTLWVWCVAGSGGEWCGVVCAVCGESGRTGGYDGVGVACVCGGGGTGFVDRWAAVGITNGTLCIRGWFRGFRDLQDLPCRMKSHENKRQQSRKHYTIILNFIKGFDYVDTNTQFYKSFSK